MSDDAHREARFTEINERARRPFIESAAEEWQRANGGAATARG